MSKELEAYKEFLDIIDVPVKSFLLNVNDKQTLERYRELRTQIEDALKDYQTLTTGLLLGDMSIIDNKELKALKIIIDKRVNVDSLLYYLKTNACDDSVLGWYNEYIVEFDDERTLTQEEYDLLNIVLNNLS